MFGSVVNTQMDNNTLIDCGPNYGGFSGADSACTFQYNDICNTPNEWLDRGGNNSAFVSSLSNNNHYNTVTEAGYTEDFVFTKDAYTDHPSEIRLPNTVKP